eukprot:symbB.v1.2.011470.t1/scaffold770.1/size163962/6
MPFANISSAIKVQENSELHRGFGFVQYEKIADAERAVAELNKTKICGREVAVDWAVDASVYTSLQREERREPEPAKLPKPKRAATKEKVEKAQEDEDPEEDPAPDKELKRMKELLGDEIEEDDDDGDDEDEDEEEDADSGAEESKTKATAKAKAKTKAGQQRKPGFDVEKGQTVFVRNVPFDANADDLKEVFRGFGKVSSIKLVPDTTGQNAHRGSAFVKFAEVCREMETQPFFSLKSSNKKSFPEQQWWRGQQKKRCMRGP